MKRSLILTAVLVFIIVANAQEKLSQDSLTAKNLKEVIVKAFEQYSKLLNTPASVNYIGPSQLNRFNNTSLVPAINSTPGVRMEERSPGSYRLNIRGSSLRSPFGVRNVKIYYNNIPFTDPGGNTYLNQLGFYNIQSVEVLKGPSSSLYGAGTGGVLLIESVPNEWKPGVAVDFSGGSFGLMNINTNVRIGQPSFQNIINFQHRESDGYRDWTNLRHDVFTWDAVVKTGDKNELSTHFLYGDLYYQTPGALTLAEYDANPRSARPTVGFVLGSKDTKAAIYEKTFLVGATNTQQFNPDWKNITTLYGAFTQLKNPTTRNYGRTSEPHFGGRTVFQYQKKLGETSLTFHAGAELQKGFTAVRIYATNKGNPDTLQTDDEINNYQAFVFTQLTAQIKTWVITGGLSLNQLNVEFTRLSTVPSTVQKRTYNNELAPRLAILKKLNNDLSLYGSISKGFSPPSTAELLPSSGIINTELNAEDGFNYELGFRGSHFNNKLYFDIDAFIFHLNNTIVQRRDITGGDYFINAGSTKQKGIETYLQYTILERKGPLVELVRLRLSDTYHDFHYKDFKQINNDYSGKQLPSIPPNTVAAGLDIQTKPGIYLFTSYNYSDPIALNDANTVYSNSYNLLTMRLGYKKDVSKKIGLELFAGVDNLFDVRYSLGNDINAFGGRYYNAAPGRNYFAGISLQFACEHQY
jgi:iron complex outermembrane recepter protein